ncbi:MAG: XdhC family protein [Eubacteriales bacterium]|nr:XdhC family protein [Eubacteriales bacterium]
MGEEKICGFYQAIADCDREKQNLAAVVLDGEAFGERALFTDGRLVWESRASGYFTVNGQAVLKAAEDENLCRRGLMRLDGIRVFCDRLGQEMRLVVCGAGHVSIPVIRIGKMMGCHVTVLEDRPSFADHARRAGADQVICESFERGLDQIEGTGSTYFVIVTRGHRYDQSCLEKIIKKRHAYIGMIGSRKRVAAVKEAVLERGGDPEIISRLHAPIGLDIGAETPAEIGVAIMGEIIEVKNRKIRTCGYEKELLHELLHGQEPAVLCTIVERRGSAPRNAGAKMLVRQDGTCLGTIGGGCMEAAIVQKALRMIRSGQRRPQLAAVDMTGEEAQEEGMICGGMVDVLLEQVEGKDGRKPVPKPEKSRDTGEGTN